MKNVSKWFTATAIVLSMTGLQAKAATIENQVFTESTVENEIVQSTEHVVTKHSLAAHMGITPEDATFGNPRNFRTESFNADHTELEPLAAGKEDSGS